MAQGPLAAQGKLHGSQNKLPPEATQAGQPANYRPARSAEDDGMRC